MSLTIFCSACGRLLRLQQFTLCKTYSSVTANLYNPRSYYELLKVSKDAEPSEIKAAYIELSKTFHPDKNPTRPNQHDEFVEISRAYEILSRPLSRREYDQTLSAGGSPTPSRVYQSGGHDPYAATPRDTGWYRDFAYATTKNPHGSSDYYGIKGVKRVGNTVIVYGCIVVAIIAGGFFFGIFKQSSSYAIRRLDAKDQRISKMYNEAKAKLRENGNEKQIELMRKRHIEFQARRAAEMNSLDSK